MPVRCSQALLAMVLTGLNISIPGQALADWSTQWDGNTEWLRSTDISNFSINGGSRTSFSSDQLEVLVGFDDYDVDYVPNPLSAGIGFATSLDEQQYRVSATYDLSLGDLSSLSFSGNYRDGYSDYRSIWINEYYRQLFSEFEGYVRADPASLGGSIEYRRELVPQNVYVDISASIAEERIAPGYERVIGPGGGLVRDEEYLNSYGFVLGVEHLLNNRVRARHEIGILEVTDRDLRLFYLGRFNWAIGKSWVSRSEGSYTVEGSDFQAWSVGTTIERDWNERWYLGVTARYYEDNGQLENSLATVTSAAPELRTFRTTLRIRYLGERFAFQIYAGPYFTDYGSVGEDIAPFINLYRDRDWFMAGFSITYPFGPL